MREKNIGLFAEAISKGKTFGAMLERHAQWSAEIEAERAVNDAADSLQDAINQPGTVCRFVRFSALVMVAPGASDAICRAAAAKELTENISEIDLYVDSVDPEIE